MPGAVLEWSPSLNRAVLGSWPDLPAGAAGHRAGDWLTGWSIARRMAARDSLMAAIREAGLPAPALPGAALDGPVTAALLIAAAPWPQSLDTLVAHRHPAALTLADGLGSVLAGLIGTLVVAPDDARAARPEWPDRAWARWASVRHVALAGGVVSGHLGAHLVARAEAWLAERRIDVRVTRAADPRHTVLRGTAVLLRRNGEPGIVLDCGGTWIKRARFDPVAGLHPLDPVLAPVPGSAADIVAHLAECVAGIAPAGAGRLRVAVALATYVDPAGQPYRDQVGLYAPLGRIPFRETLAAAVGAGIPGGVEVEAIHDGTAAVGGAGRDDPSVDACIVLGTALGSGLRVDLPGDAP